ncbi:MAG: hypothetical protein ACX98W_01455 [bacterium]
MTEDEMRERLKQLEDENARLRQRAAGALDLRVSQKGGVSLYGLRRFPITFYKEEWLNILDMADQIRAFIVEHDSELRKRGGKNEASAQIKSIRPASGTEPIELRR